MNNPMKGMTQEQRLEVIKGGYALHSKSLNFIERQRIRKAIKRAERAVKRGRRGVK